MAEQHPLVGTTEADDVEAASYSENTEASQGQVSRVRRLAFVVAGLFGTALVILSVVAHPSKDTSEDTSAITAGDIIQKPYLSYNKSMRLVPTAATSSDSSVLEYLEKQSCGKQIWVPNLIGMIGEDCPVPLQYCQCKAFGATHGRKLIAGDFNAKRPKGCSFEVDNHEMVYFNTDPHGGNYTMPHKEHCGTCKIIEGPKDVQYGDYWMSKFDICRPVEELQVPFHGWPVCVILHGRNGGRQKMLSWAQRISRYGRIAAAGGWRAEKGNSDLTLDQVKDMVDFWNNPLNAAKYNSDPRRVSLLGYSLGATIASMASGIHLIEDYCNAITIVCGVYGTHGELLDSHMPITSVYHSTDDPIVPFYPGVPIYMRYAAERNAPVIPHFSTNAGHWPHVRYDGFWTEVNSFMTMAGRNKNTWVYENFTMPTTTTTGTSTHTTAPPTTTTEPEEVEEVNAADFNNLTDKEADIFDAITDAIANDSLTQNMSDADTVDDLLEPNENLNDTVPPEDVVPPMEDDADIPQDAENENKRQIKTPGVGSWGGECTCPNGQKYLVGNIMNMTQEPPVNTETLACYNGKHGEFIKESKEVWNGTAVYCALVTEVTEFEVFKNDWSCEEMSHTKSSSAENLTHQQCVNFCAYDNYAAHWFGKATTAGKTCLCYSSCTGGEATTENTNTVYEIKKTEIQEEGTPKELTPGEETLKEKDEEGVPIALEDKPEDDDVWRDDTQGADVWENEGCFGCCAKNKQPWSKKCFWKKEEASCPCEDCYQCISF